MGSRNKTRDSLSAVVAEATGFSQVNCRNVLDTLLVEIICRCREGQKVSIHDFGIFSRITRAERGYYDGESKKFIYKSGTRMNYDTIKFWVHPMFEEKVNNEALNR